VADGVILGGGATTAAVLAGLEHVERGARAAGRNVGEVAVVLWQPFCAAGDEGAARVAVKAYVARAVIGALAIELPRSARRTVERIREAYDYGQHMARDASFHELVPDELVGDFAIAGSLEACRSRIEALARLPVAQLAVVPYTAEGASRAQMLSTFVDLARVSARPRPEPG
jgi:5,10-methylenetetrahydromethanopterin reductase